MKYCISVTCTNIEEKKSIFNMCQYSIKKYCDKYNFALSIHTKSKYNIGKINGYNFGNFEKFQTFEDLNVFDRVWRLDADVLIMPNCPNIFDFVPLDKVGAVYEDVGRMTRDRRKQLWLVQDQLGKTPDDWTSGYFNGGSVVFSKQHQEALNLTQQNIDDALNKDLGGCKEQTLLNWKIHNLGFGIHSLSTKFNNIAPFGPGHNAYIIHYAGGQAGKLNRMKNDFSKYFKRSS